MDENTVWKEVVIFYRDFLHIPEIVTEYLSVYDILYSCCIGMSNKSIAESLEVEESYVKEMLMKYINFVGWNKDLIINPLYVYNKVSGNKDFYIASVMAIQELITKTLVNKSFDICKRFTKIEAEINKHYG